VTYHAYRAAALSSREVQISATATSGTSAKCSSSWITVATASRALVSRRQRRVRRLKLGELLVADLEEPQPPLVQPLPRGLLDSTER
jgi:hypothetical protein